MRSGPRKFMIVLFEGDKPIGYFGGWGLCLSNGNTMWPMWYEEKDRRIFKYRTKKEAEANMLRLQKSIEESVVSGFSIQIINTTKKGGKNNDGKNHDRDFRGRIGIDARKAP